MNETTCKAEKAQRLQQELVHACGTSNDAAVFRAIASRIDENWADDVLQALQGLPESDALSLLNTQFGPACARAGIQHGMGDMEMCLMAIPVLLPNDFVPPAKLCNAILPWLTEMLVADMVEKCFEPDSLLVLGNLYNESQIATTDDVAVNEMLRDFITLAQSSSDKLLTPRIPLTLLEAQPSICADDRMALQEGSDYFVRFILFAGNFPSGQGGNHDFPLELVWQEASKRFRFYAVEEIQDVVDINPPEPLVKPPVILKPMRLHDAIQAAHGVVAYYTALTAASRYMTNKHAGEHGRFEARLSMETDPPAIVATLSTSCCDESFHVAAPNIRAAMSAERRLGIDLSEIGYVAQFNDESGRVVSLLVH